jgi:hypothetical protein
MKRENCAGQSKRLSHSGTLYFSGWLEKSRKVPIISDQSEACKPIFICDWRGVSDFSNRPENITSLNVKVILIGQHSFLIS